jgi:hypothetical protein
LHGGGAGGIGARLRALVCCGCKGRRGSSSACLNRGAGRKAKRKGTGRPAGLPLMTGGPSGRKEGKGQRGNGRGLEWAINCLNWRARWGEKGRGEGGGAAESARLRRRAGEQGGEEKEGGRERLTGGARVSASAKKRKGERERRAGAG